MLVSTYFIGFCFHSDPSLYHLRSISLLSVSGSSNKRKLPGEYFDSRKPTARQELWV